MEDEYRFFNYMLHLPLKKKLFYSITEKWASNKSEQNATKWNVHVFNKSLQREALNPKINSKAIVFECFKIR